MVAPLMPLRLWPPVRTPVQHRSPPHSSGARLPPARLLPDPTFLHRCTHSVSQALAPHAGPLPHVRPPHSSQVLTPAQVAFLPPRESNTAHPCKAAPKVMPPLVLLFSDSCPLLDHLAPPSHWHGHLPGSVLPNVFWTTLLEKKKDNLKFL